MKTKKHLDNTFEIPDWTLNLGTDKGKKKRKVKLLDTGQRNVTVAYVASDKAKCRKSAIGVLKIEYKRH